MPRHPQQPDEARRDRAAVVVVRDHDVVVADPRLRQAGREDRRIRQRVPALGDGRRRGQPSVEIDEHGARQVTPLIGVPPG